MVVGLNMLTKAEQWGKCVWDGRWRAGTNAPGMVECAAKAGFNFGILNALTYYLMDCLYTYRI